MKPFAYERPSSLADALALLADPGTVPLAGGTNLVDRLKESLEAPTRLLDIQRLPLSGIERSPEGGLRIGALVSNADVAWHPEVLARYPLLSRAILAGASPQLRNMATTGGNLLQRTRCYYFYDAALPCNKRLPGSGCPALTGQNRIHAILGASPHCVATHPSDMCVALAALDARVHVASAGAERVLSFAEVHRLPGDTPERDTNIGPHELVTHVELPAAGFASHHAYLKIRDRSSYAFALVSVAAALDLDGGNIRTARLALGGVAHKPWRDEAAEALLVGQPPSRAAFLAVADHVLRDARGLAHNAFKIELARRAIVRGFEAALGQGEHGGPSAVGGGVR